MPELARIKVSLRVIGDALDPDEITRLLRIEPTAFARRGDRRRTASGREVVAASGAWLLDAEGPGDLDTQIGSLLATLPDDPSVWLDLTCRFRCDVFCGLFVTEGNEGAELHPRVLSMLGDRGLRLGLDIYTCSD